MPVAEFMTERGRLGSAKVDHLSIGVVPHSGLTSNPCRVRRISHAGAAGGIERDKSPFATLSPPSQ